ncbi:MAG: DegT/DnrJ/EryC1/StrS family aminotransferase [Candidatus Muiribacteriota bacterium]
MKIPLLDLKSQYKKIKNEVDEVVLKVLNNCNFIMGEEVIKFEENIKKYTGAKFAVSCASGSDALLLSLIAIDIKPGDEIITTPYTFFATAGAIVRLGAVPVFVDINENDCNLNADLIEEKITPKTKAIIPVHLYGKCADMEKILKIAEKYKLKVVEDACQAIGAWFKFSDGMYKQAGTMGDTGCFSFFPTKNLGGAGDGGMIVTNNDELFQKLKILRVHGSKPKYYHKFVGINSRLDTIQAAILNVKIKYLEEWTQARIEIASLYCDFFKENSDNIEFYEFFDYVNQHIYHQFVIQTENRDELSNYLNENGVSTAMYYPLPLHLQVCFKYLAYKAGDMPVAEKKSKTTLALPIYPELDYKKVIKGLKCFFQ